MPRSFYEFAMNRRFITIAACSAGLWAYTFGYASKELDSARGLVEQWVQVEETVSREAVAWKEKESSLRDLIEVSQMEISKLKEELSRIDASTTQADEQRIQMVEEREDLARRVERIRGFLIETELRLRELEPVFPSPLKRSLAPLYARIPENPQSTRLGVAERMQTVITMLTTVLAFDDKVTVDLDVRELSDGSSGEVKTLWVGLAAAYYLDSANGEAGYGQMSETGWQWVSQSGLRDDIEEAVALAEGQTQEARFIELPVSVRNR